MTRRVRDLEWVRDELRIQAGAAVKRAAFGTTGIVILTDYEARNMADMIDRSLATPEPAEPREETR